MASGERIPQEMEDIEDSQEFLDPKEFEVIEIGEDSNMDDIADQLMSAMSRVQEGAAEAAAAQEAEVEEEQEQDALDKEQDVIAIVEDAEEKTATHVFSKHKESVFSCAVSSCGSIAVTGGKDDIAYVWNTYTGQLLLTCTGHEDSVTYVGLNHDNQYVATADMNGKVQVWRIRDGECVFSFETGDGGGGDGDDEADTYENWLSWHHGSNVLFCGTRNSGIWVWLIPQQITKTIPQFGPAVTCGCCTADGKRLVVGYTDGKTCVVDIKSQQAVHVEPRGQHCGEVLAVSCHPENTLAITGGSDGTANIINTNTGKVVGQIDMEQLSSSTSCPTPSSERVLGVEAVGFCSANPALAVVTDITGLIVIYEMTRQIVRHVLRQAAGTSRLVLPPLSPLGYTGGLDGVVRCWDLQEGKLLAKYTGHTETVLGLSIDQSGRILLSCSDDCSARVFSVDPSPSS